MSRAGSKRSGWLASVLVGLSLFGTTGCYRNSLIPRAELQKLDGFETRSPGDHPPRALRDVDGSEVRFATDSKLWLKGPTLMEGGQFSQIHVTPSQFDGVLVDGKPLHLDLESIQAGEVRTFDGASTTLLVVGGTVITVGTVLTAVAIGAALHLILSTGT